MLRFIEAIRVLFYEASADNEDHIASAAPIVSYDSPYIIWQTKAFTNEKNVFYQEVITFLTVSPTAFIIFNTLFNQIKRL